MNPGKSRDKDKPEAKHVENENAAETSAASTFKRSRFGCRHVQILFVSICLTLGMAMRANFSVAIVAMIDNTTSTNPNVPTFHWNNTRILLASFFWGYVIPQIGAGYLAKKYGAKYILFGSTFVNTVAFVLIPICAEYIGSTGVIIMRVIQGFSQGSLFPCAHTIMGKWAPAEERSFLGIIVYSGISCGSILSFIITGFICSSWYGWPYSFYLFGLCGFIWCALYLKFGHNSPATHPSIKPGERQYIEKSLGQSSGRADPAIPWKSILTCVPFWALVAANTGSAWGYIMMMTQIPSYLGKALKFKIATNGVVSAVPYMAAAVSGFMFAPLSDYLIKRNILSRIQARRTFHLTGSYGLTVCLLLLAYIAKSQVLAVCLLSLGNICYSLTLVGWSVNHIDLSPKFAGILSGISITAAQGIAMLSPLIVHFIVTDLSDSNQWKIVFVIASVFYFVCATVFGIFSSATRQKWDSSDPSETTVDPDARAT